ncbi:MAG: cell filamentation protein Fic, partial [Paludibacteraceae bacterium]|nr:cell filamentation protein Fic [Paludibacteraceae bacterium]
MERGEDINKKMVADRIDSIIYKDDFCLSMDYLKQIHMALFDGIFPMAGIFRNFNVQKREVVLNGDTV